MAHAERQDLRERAILDLLEESETEDFIPSDDDLGDVEFVVHESEECSSSSSSSESDEGAHEVENDPNISNISRGRSQYRAGVRHRRGARSRGGVGSRGNVPSASGSTANANWSVTLPFPPRELQLSQPAYLPTNINSFPKVSYFQQYIDDTIVDLIVGIKAFVLANPNGMICDFDIYESITTYPDLDGTNFGLRDKAVLNLTETLVPGHVLYCDRFFTSLKLVEELEKKGIGCTGTLMKNRIPKDVREMLLADKILKRRGRGSSQVVVRNDKKLAITKWFDNKPVILMSSVEGKDEEDTCQIWCKQQRAYLTIKRPRCVRRYNQNMGGVDLADRLLAVCPNRYRTRKWTQRFIAHMIDLSVSNAWLLYKIDQKTMGNRKVDQLRQYKLSLGEYLIESNMGEKEAAESDEEGVSEKSRKRSANIRAPIPSKKQRTSQVQYLPILVDVQGRCRVCHANKTFFQCSLC